MEQITTMEQTDDNYKFCFKLVFTTRIKYYFVNPNTSIKNFIDDIKNKVRIDFEINDDENIEIIESGQPNDENAYCLTPSDLPLKQIYHNKHQITSFYIRKI